MRRATFGSTGEGTDPEYAVSETQALTIRFVVLAEHLLKRQEPPGGRRRQRGPRRPMGVKAVDRRNALVCAPGSSRPPRGGRPRADQLGTCRGATEQPDSLNGNTEAHALDHEEVSQEEFIAGVLSGGKRQDAMLQLATAASPAPGTRASDVRHLTQFVNEVLSILRSPINPFEGMLEAPSPIVRLYQTHKQSMKDLRPNRDKALEPLLQDALAALYNSIGPIAWTTVEDTDISRTAPPDSR